MQIPIIVPDLGTGNEPVRLSAWFVDAGDLVLAGDLIAEVLIPGVTFDIMSESAGRVIEIQADIDSTIQAGDVLVWLENDHTVDDL